MSGVNKIRGYGQMIKDLALSSTRVVTTNHRSGGKKAWEGRKKGCFGCWTR